jgi:glycosyltransferase involved in cell wall biosynthesis
MQRSEKNGPLKVLHLLPRFIPGGAAQVVLSIASGTSSHGVQSLVGFGQGGWANRLDELGIGWRVIPIVPSTPGNMARSFFELRRIARQQGVSLIHSHHRFTSVVGRTVAASLKIPFVCTVHDLAAGNALVSRYGCGRTITVFSQAVEDHLVREFGVRREYIHKITMGLPSARSITEPEVLALRNRQNCAPEIPVITFAGRLALEKGPQVLLEAAAKVLADAPRTLFWIIGDGELRQELGTTAGRLGLAQNVTFWGWRDDLPLLFACSDVVVVPSLLEGFGLTAVEALRAGRPVIASRVGGLPEIVRDEKNGLLVSAGQPDQLAHAIVRLISNQELLRQMAQNARAEIQGRFDGEQMVKAFLDIYRSASGFRS